MYFLKGARRAAADQTGTEWPFGKDGQWYIDGPKKEWTERDHDRYYRWRDRLSASRKAETTDEQILPRQKAILNGNKITTEIWNYGSISSPGNRVTDIVWETLGYGYEFGWYVLPQPSPNTAAA